MLAGVIILMHSISNWSAHSVEFGMIYSIINLLFLLYSDDVSLEGLQEELEECKDDIVSNIGIAIS